MSVVAIQRSMSAIEFSIQSLDNIWAMSIRKCWIGVIEWYFFFKPWSVNFQGRRRLAFFMDQYRGIMILCRGWLMFCMPSKRKHAGVSRNKTSVALERKNLTDRKILSASVCKKHCTISTEKYQSRLYNGRCRQFYFLFNPRIIFGWCLLENARSASPVDFC